MVFKLISEPGIEGVFTREEAHGAIPNGTRVVKAANDIMDDNLVSTSETLKVQPIPLGTLGTVLGSVYVDPELYGDYPEEVGISQTQAELLKSSSYFYFIEWDNFPRKAVGLLGYKIDKA